VKRILLLVGLLVLMAQAFAVPAIEGVYIHHPSNFVTVYNVGEVEPELNVRIVKENTEKYDTAARLGKIDLYSEDVECKRIKMRSGSSSTRINNAEAYYSECREKPTEEMYSYWYLTRHLTRDRMALYEWN